MPELTIPERVTRPVNRMKRRAQGGIRAFSPCPAPSLKKSVPVMNKLRASYRLLRPGIGFAVLVTILPGMLLGQAMPSLVLVFNTLLGTLLLVMAASCYNQVFERDTDARMERTRERILPLGILSYQSVVMIGSSMLGIGFLVLWVFVNPLTAGLGLFSFLYYAIIYTLVLKRSTEANTVLGGVSGAIGPLMGQAAVTGSLGYEGWVLYALIFFWQPAHFWGLAIYLKDDYAAAGLPMLPVVRGVAYTIRMMIVYQVLLLLAAGLLTIPTGMAGVVFLAPTLTFGGYVLWRMVRLARQPDRFEARRVFFWTIAHLVLWHLAFSADRLLQKPPGFFQ